MTPTPSQILRRLEHLAIGNPALQQALATACGPVESQPFPDKANWADIDHQLAPYTWDWTSWLPSSMLTILAGESGSGKSALALRLAACYLLAQPWPDGAPFTLPPGDILWCEAEAAQSLNLQRARAWGLPIERIFTPLPDVLSDFRFSETDHLSAFITHVHNPLIRLVIIDSLSAASFHGETSSETTAILRLLAGLARDTLKPFLLIHHLRKRSGRDPVAGVPIERLRGTSAIAQTARLVWALDAPDPNQPNVKRLQVIKSNLTAFPPPLGLIIHPAGLQFVPAPKLPGQPPVEDLAIDLLQSLLCSGPLPAVQVEQYFFQQGVSLRTLMRARHRLGVISRKTKTGWMLSLSIPTSSQECQFNPPS